MPAYQIETRGALDGVTPLVLPTELPAPSDGGVIKIDAGGLGLGRIDLSALAGCPGAPVWVRAFHIELGDGTRASRTEVILPRTQKRQALAPIVSSPADELLMRPFILNPQGVVPEGSMLELLSDDTGPEFAGAPAVGPHFIYLDIVPLTNDEMMTLAQDMTAVADTQLSAIGDCMISSQQVAASSSEIVGEWLDPRSRTTSASGQIISAEVAIGDAPAAGETMQIQVSGEFEGVSTLLAQTTIDDSFSANSRTEIPIILPNNELFHGTRIRVTRSYTAGGGPTPLSQTVIKVRASSVVPGELAGEGIPNAITISLPPMSSESSEPVMRDMGRAGTHIMGHYWLVSTTHYVYYTIDGVGFDPGGNDANGQPYSTGLAGRTGIEVALGAGNHDETAVAAATALALTAAGFPSTAVGGAVEVTGAGSASAGTTDFDSAGAVGVLGMQNAFRGGTSSFTGSSLRGAQLDPASLPADPFIVTGGRMSVSNVHVVQATMAMYQGGVAGDFETATRLGIIGTTSGSATDTQLYVESPEPFVVDPANGPIWLMVMDSGGGWEAPADAVGSGAGTSSDYLVTGGDGIWTVTGGPSSSDPADFPASLAAVASSFPFFPSMAISFITQDDFQNNMRVVGRIGTREQDASLFTGTSAATLAVGNSFDGPATLGMSVENASVNYNAHVLGSDYRLSLLVGGAAFNDFSGAAWYDIGAAGAGGVATGWVDREPPGTIAIPPSSRIWIGIHHTETPGGGADTVLAFDAGNPDVYGPDTNPAAYYNGNTSESEFDDGSLGGIPPSTNVEFDEAVPQVPVDGQTLTPNGFLYNNDNNVGVRMRYTVLGFAVSA
jgi:hypothetical protein